MENVIQPKLVSKKIKTAYMWANLGIVIQTCIAMGIAMIASMLIGFIVAFNMAATADGFGDVMQKVQDVSQEYMMVTNAVAYVVANLVSAFFVVKFTKVGKFKNWFSKTKASALDGVLAPIALCGTALIVTTLLTKFSTAFSNTGENLSDTLNSGLLSDNAFVTVVSILYIAIIGPITEEILCRGAILNAASVVSRKFGIVASAILFGLMHGNLIQIANATVLGLILGYIADKTQSLVIPCIMHIFNNSVSVVFSILSEKFPGDTMDTISGVATIALMVLGIISLVILLKKHGKIDDKKDGMLINKVVSDEEIAATGLKTSKLTAGYFFTRITFMIVVAYAAIMSIVMLFV